MKPAFLWLKQFNKKGGESKRRPDSRKIGAVVVNKPLN
jgi:hypothetical protein